MRAVVTGGSGFIGSHVVDHLVTAGYDVVVIDRLRPGRVDVEHADVDIADLAGLVDATAGADAVFHLAAFADVNDVAADPVGAVDTNVTSTARVWEACRRNGVGRAVLASTVWVYGASPDAGVLDETALFDLARAGHLYTATKVSAELVVRSYHALYGQEFTILRYGIPYGPGMRPSLVIPKFVGMAERGEPITVDGDGLQHRNYVYVGDLAAAHVLALAPEGANEVFNLEGGEQISIRRLVDTIAERVAPVDVSYGPPRDGDYAGAVISAARAADVLGWRPGVTFDDGMSRYLDWHRGEEKPTPRVTAQPAPLPANALVSLAAGALVLPALVLGSGASPRDRLLGVAAVVVAAAFAAITRATRREGPSPLTVGACLAAIWLLSQCSGGPALLAVAPILGCCLASLVGIRTLDWRAASAGGVLLVGAYLVTDRSLFWAAASLCLVAAGAGGLHLPSPTGRRPWAVALASGLIVAAVSAGVGASSASTAWFGPVLSHGSRSGGEVALTATGLPSGRAARRLLSVLDQTGARTTFFESPAALRAQPALLRRLVASGVEIGLAAPARGRLLLDIGYGDQLDRAAAAFEATVGRCPTVVRGAGAWHTPFTTRAAHRHAMKVVTWDVKVPNAGRRDPRSVAAAILAQVRPGSIVDLGFAGDGGGGDVATVLRELVPGLRAKHLTPVGLTRFAGAPARTHC